MKSFYLTVLFFAISVGALFSQTPGAFNYQAVVRNSAGEILANHNVSLRISIVKNSASGTVVYTETHNVTTNVFGLINLKIGEGTAVSGAFDSDTWKTGKHFIKTEIDPDGGSSYSDLGTSELLAVPYAIHAQTVANDKVDDADADPANEIQTLSLSGTLLELSNGGGSVTLPTSGSGSADNWGTQKVVSDETLTGEGTTANPLHVVADGDGDDSNEIQTLTKTGNTIELSNGGGSVTDENTQLTEAEVDAFVANNGYLTEEIDADTTNEIQQISISGTTLQLSKGGGTVVLPTSEGGSADNWGTQTVVSDATLTGEGTTANPLHVVADGDGDDSNEIQTISKTDGTIELSDGGGSVDINESPWEVNDDGIIYNENRKQVTIGDDGGSSLVGETKSAKVAISFNKLFVGAEDSDNAIVAHSNGTGAAGKFYNLGNGYAARFQNNGTAWPTVTFQNVAAGGEAARFYSTIRIADGTQGTGKVLTSDANGVASWQTPATGSSSLWTESGSDIYRNSGNVAIGTSTIESNYKLDVQAGYSRLRVKGSYDAYLYLDKGADDRNTAIVYLVDDTPKFYTGLLTTNNFRISSSATTLKGVEVDTNGDVTLSGDLSVSDNAAVEGKLTVGVAGGGAPIVGEKSGVVASTPVGLTVYNGVEVGGDLSVDGNITTETIKITNGAADGKVLTSNASGVASWQTITPGAWTESGSDIYRTTGNVGIGTNSPSYLLDIQNTSGHAVSQVKASVNAHIIIDKGSDTKNGDVIFKTGGTTKFYTGLVGSNDYSISSISSSLKGLKVKTGGDVEMSDDLTVEGDVFINQNLEVEDEIDIDDLNISGNEIHTSTTGTSNNLLPFAYGYINVSGTKYNCTDNVGTITKSTGEYVVNISGLGTNYVVMVTKNYGDPWVVCMVKAKSSSSFTVNMYNTKTDALVTNGGFSFMVYKN